MLHCTGARGTPDVFETAGTTVVGEMPVDLAAS